MTLEVVATSAVQATSDGTPWVVLGASLASAVVGILLQRVLGRGSVTASTTDLIEIPPLVASKAKLTTTERVTLFVAVIAGLSSLSGIILNQNGTLRLEARKFEEARKDEALKHSRSALAELGHDLSIGVQRAAWLVWYAENDPASVTQKALTEYEAFTKEFLPKLVASQTLLAAHDVVAYRAVVGAVYEYYKLDTEITKSAVMFRKDRALGIKSLVSLAGPSAQLQSSLPTRFAEAANPAPPAK